MNYNYNTMLIPNGVKNIDQFTQKRKSFKQSC